MILLNEVAKKIEDVLNGTDTEVAALGLNPPTAFFFKAATEGFHIDKNFDIPEGKNFIPVFISSMGGQFNPVPDLMQVNYVIPIAIYFPVRFKDDMFKINEYIARAFVGRHLNYGVGSGRAISNISVAQFGEIVDLDLKQFGTWQQTMYKKPLAVMEPYIQMTISLYLSTAAADFVYGNDAVATLTITSETTGLSNDDKTDELTFVSQNLQSNTDPAAQQILGDYQTEGLPQVTTYSASAAIYIKNNNFYKYLIEKWFDGTLQTVELSLTVDFMGKQYTRACFIQSVNLPLTKGELATMTITFLKKAVVE